MRTSIPSRGLGVDLGLGSTELGLAFVVLDHAIGPDHAGEAGALNQRIHLLASDPHQPGLRLDAGGNAIGPAGSPEAQHPRCDLRQVLRTDGERPERVAQPPGQLAQHILGRERHDIGEGESAGIAAARLLGHALAVDEQHRTAGLNELVCARETDDARTDDDDVCVHL